MAEDATPEQVDGVTATIRRSGLELAPEEGGHPTRIRLAGNHAKVEPSRLERLPGIMRVVDPSHPFKKVSWESRSEPTVVELPNGTRIGGREIVVMAGPCALEPECRVVEAAHALRAAGAAVLHAGVLRPHPAPYSCASYGDEALRALDRVREETGMAVAAEALDIESARILADHVDVLRIGPDNMQNFSLLRQAARLGKPVMLVRGHAATITELLLAAEYVLVEGNDGAILCEAGVLGLSADERRILDLTSVPVINSLSHLPVVVAPVSPDGAAAVAMGCAAAAAGADGVIVEVRSAPALAAPDALAGVVERMRSVAAAMARGVAAPPTGAAARGRRAGAHH